MNQAGTPIGEIPFTRTGLLGFVGPVRVTQKNKRINLAEQKILKLNMFSHVAE